MKKGIESDGIKNIIQNNDLPIIYKKMVIENYPKQAKLQLVKMDFYSTTYFKLSNHHKPISKISKPVTNNNEDTKIL
ncbi:MAG: hypothetical protein EAZ85_12850 [Bacteroidetes bacterium]|nr:MAG: hypothetical protein EAZ85_12850 [Bacteroidota bacterium]TAG87283.1 MAG: hypothetical protein EAZ20_10930 [Bacteroidota bacterium]